MDGFSGDVPVGHVFNQDSMYHWSDYGNTPLINFLSAVHPIDKLYRAGYLWGFVQHLFNDYTMIIPTVKFLISNAPNR